MSRRLHVADGFTFPVDVATEALAILGNRGAGKSNTAVVMAEEMWKAGIPWAAIDPKGDWWGMRSSVDGRGPGLALPVLGGLHGDLPLEPAGGTTTADLIIDERLTCILDVSEFSKGEQIRFLIDFFDRLFRRRRQKPEPLHLFLEEAHEYLPQRVMRDEAKLVNVASRIVKQGRSFGLGVTIASQRSASLNKDVLTQCGTLIAMRVVAPQDRKAVLAWVEEHAEGKEIANELPGLADGEAWVFSPRFLRKVERVRFRRRETFDSGSTPTLGKAGPSPTLADIDLGAIAERMAAAIERAKEDDPRELRRRIVELRKQVTTARRESENLQNLKTPEAERVEVPVPVLGDDVAKALGVKAGDLAVLAKQIRDDADRIFDALERVQKRPQAPGRPVPRPTLPTGAKAPAGPPAPTRAPRQTPPASENGYGLDSRSGRSSRGLVLDALAWCETVGLGQPTRPALAFLAETRPTSGGFKNNLGALRTAGLVDYPTAGTVALTAEGRALAREPDAPLSAHDLQAQVLARVTGSQAAIIRVLVDAYPSALTRDELADTVGVPATSGGFKNNLGALRTLDLIDYPAPGNVEACPVLFLEGAGS